MGILDLAGKGPAVLQGKKGKDYPRIEGMNIYVYMGQHFQSLNNGHELLQM